MQCEHCQKREATYVVRYQNRTTFEPAGEERVCKKCSVTADYAGRHPSARFEAHVSPMRA